MRSETPSHVPTLRWQYATESASLNMLESSAVSELESATIESSWIRLGSLVHQARAVLFGKRPLFNGSKDIQRLLRERLMVLEMEVADPFSRVPEAALRPCLKSAQSLAASAQALGLSRGHRYPFTVEAKKLKSRVVGTILSVSVLCHDRVPCTGRVDQSSGCCMYHSVRRCSSCLHGRLQFFPKRGFAETVTRRSPRLGSG